MLISSLAKIFLLAFSVPTLLTAASQHAFAQTPGPNTDAATAAAQSDVNPDLPVTYLVGLPNLKANSKGKLRLKPDALVFSNDAIEAPILLNAVTATYIGDETVETGGTFGKIARKAIPYGGGSALASVTHKSVDLLTINYHDSLGGYHGAVFVLPAKQADLLHRQIDAKLSAAAERPAASCSGNSPAAGTLLIAPITANGVEIPAEYRALLYEHLVQEIGKTYSAGTLHRAGDVAAGSGCSALILQVELNQFNKGNQALRASTGPVGFFVGVTSLGFNIKITDQAGKLILDKDLKTKQRGDTDSLNLAHAIAKNVSKRLNKATKPPKSA